MSSRVRIIEAYTSHTLLISRSEIEDGGTYAVTISNKHGRQTSTASVYIKGKYLIITVLMEITNIIFLNYQWFYIFCLIIKVICLKRFLILDKLIIHIKLYH